MQQKKYYYYVHFSTSLLPKVLWQRIRPPSAAFETRRKETGSPASYQVASCVDDSLVRLVEEQQEIWVSTSLPASL